MKTKHFASLIACLFSIILIAGLANAAVFEMDLISVPQNISHDSTSFSVLFNLTYTGTSSSISIDLSDSAISAGQATITFDSDQVNLSQNEVKVLSATINFNAYQVGNIAGSIKAVPSSGTEIIKTFSVPILSSKELTVANVAVSSGSTVANVAIKNSGNQPLSNIQLTKSGDFSASLSTSTIASLAAGASQTITVTILEDLEDLEIGANTLTITATASDGTADSGVVSVNGKYCNYENNGNLKLSNLEVDVNSGYGNNEEWFAFDEIEVSLDIDNKGNDDIKNIEIEWGLYNTVTGNWIVDDKESDFDLKDGKDKSVTFTFILDKDIDEFEDGDFVFYVKATGDDKEFGGNETCVSDSIAIDVQVESDFVIASDVQIDNSDSVQCGSTIQISGEVWNIGSDDQDEVSVDIFNSELGIDERFDIGDIDALDSEKMDISLKIPSNAESKTYYLRLQVVDEDGDVYENDYDDDLSESFLEIKVTGCSSSASIASISAVLESGGNPGEELVVKATVTNTESSTQTYTLNAAGYSNWATLGQVSPQTFTLSSGQSQTAYVTLNVNDNAEGDKLFSLELTSSKGTMTQPVSVSISSGSSGITGAFIGANNWYLWGIGLLNVVLVVIIVIVAIRVARS